MRKHSPIRGSLMQAYATACQERDALRDALLSIVAVGESARGYDELEQAITIAREAVSTTTEEA